MRGISGMCGVQEELLDCLECHGQFPVRMFRQRGLTSARLSCAGCVYKLKKVREKKTAEGMSDAGWVLFKASRECRVCLPSIRLKATTPSVTGMPCWGVV